VDLQKLVAKEKKGTEVVVVPLLKPKEEQKVYTQKVDLQKLVANENKGTEVVSVPLLKPKEEQKAYTQKEESGVYITVLSIADFSEKQNLGIAFHRKIFTEGCSKAIEARSQSLGQSLDDSQELKAMALQESNGTKVFIYMAGNYELPRNTQGEINFETLSTLTSLDIRKKAKDKGLVTGRINPISMHLAYPHAKQFYFIPYEVSKASMYTNAGTNTWGIEIPRVVELMKKISALEVEGIAIPQTVKLEGVPDIKKIHPSVNIGR
jgi:hypothetical protein